MKQKLKFVCVFMMFIMLLTGCNEYQQKKEDVSLSNDYNKSEVKSRNDIIIVYDKNNNKILETKEQSKIDYYSELVGNSVENIDEKNVFSVFKSVPTDAVISYKYTMVHKKETGEEEKVDFYVYENYPYITLEGIPALSPLTWELSSEDNKCLQNPKDDITIKEPAGNMGIASGSYYGTSFGTYEYSLNKANGEYVIFWAKNTGKVDIIISINEYSKELTLYPNEEGFISEKFSRDEQNFTFKAVPTPNGGDIGIDYKIKQSNTNK